jgi:hypothetical protein
VLNGVQLTKVSASIAEITEPLAMTIADRDIGSCAASFRPWLVFFIAICVVTYITMLAVGLGWFSASGAHIYSNSCYHGPFKSNRGAIGGAIGLNAFVAKELVFSKAKMAPRRTKPNFCLSLNRSTYSNSR